MQRIAFRYRHVCVCVFVRACVRACVRTCALDGASDSLDGDREIKRRLIGRHNMMTRLW